ncbi:MAG: DUF4132 domain-containing protein [Janthinobacterium lividum]
MLGKALLNLFRGGLPSAIAKAEGGLTPADREAVLADLTPADAVEPGLGEKLATYVVAGPDAMDGAGEALLLHLDTLMRRVQPGQAQPGLASLYVALLPSSHAWDQDKAEQARQERRLEVRRRVLWGLQGFDAAAMRRYGQVLGQVRTGNAGRYGFPGSDASPMWARTLLDVASTYNHRRGKELSPHGFLTMPRLCAMLALDGPHVPPLVDCLFVDRDAGHYSGHTIRMLAMDGMAAALAAEPDAVAAALKRQPPATRAQMAEYFARAGLLDAVPAFFEMTFALAGNGSKVTRGIALAALASVSAAQVRARAAEALGSKSVDDRLAAIHVLAARGAEELPALVEHEAQEASKKVLEAIATARATLEAPQAAAADGPADGPEGYTGMDGRWVGVPPWTPSPDTWPADAGDRFRDMMRTANEMARCGYGAASAEERADRNFPKEFVQPFDLGTAKELQDVVSGKLRPAQAHASVRHAANPYVGYHRHLNEARAFAHKAAAAILDDPSMSLPALMRLRLAGETVDGWHGWQGMMRNMLMRSLERGTLGDAISRRVKAGTDLRELAAIAEAEGFATAPALAGAIGNLWGRTVDDDDAPQVWPLLAAHLSVLDNALKPNSGRHLASASVMGLLGDFPVVPRRYFPHLIDRAATGNPGGRNQARALLRDAGDLTPIIATMLRDGDAARRTGGARWLRERRDPAAILPLRATLGTEKNLTARAALLAALAACGDDIGAEFSEERMLAEAEAGLPRTKADYKDLFDADTLPALHWTDGREVPPKVVQWWFTRAHKLRQPGGDPLLHMALDRLDRRDAERLGQAVLAAFIQFDTRKVSLADANAYAQQHAPGRHQSYLRWNKDYTEEQAFAEIRREKLGEYLGSALDHQGLLALARFVVPADAVAMVKRYLRDHGKRASQCRALLDAVAANPVPAVLQLILATSQRHKQPGTRKYAGELANALAEERGWTAAELADRTIPAAGLDDDGVLELPIGDRAYRAHAAVARGKAARDGLVLVLENPEGKPVSALPTPSDLAGAEEAKAAKKALANARKELKQTVESQTGRLYAAMCSNRVWPAADFDAFLLRHPIAGLLLRRLVLLGLDTDGRSIASFRALDDGTFSDAADGPVDPGGFAGISIAHRVTLGAEAAAAWAAHLGDYEVAPLFEQLDRPVLTAADAAAKAVTDRVGWMIDSTALRKAAAELGYQRGSIEDGGCFYGYERHLPDLGLAAVVNFTGSFVPETERRAGALRDLTFVRLRDGKVGWGGDGIPLGKVPPVLLSEAWNDLHAIATAGTGHDADWEKKAQW